MKDGCEIVLQGKKSKPEGMKNKQFEENDKIALTNMFLALDNSLLFNVEIETITKRVWERLKRLNEEKSFVIRFPQDENYIIEGSMKGEALVHK